MRGVLLCLAIGCTPVPTGPSASMDPALPGLEVRSQPDPDPPEIDEARAGTVIDRTSDFAFDGGRIQFEMRRDDNRLVEVAYNRYAVAVVIEWEYDQLDNLGPTRATTGVAVLPAAARPNAQTTGVVLTTFGIIDGRAAYRRRMQFHARFGDPRARPQPYAYGLPYPAKTTFAVLQGFHGAFSHRGSNEYAVDFDCPVATHVLAARPGIVVATNAAAQGAGTTPEFLEYRRTNFVIVQHDDGTLGEYMHLAPSGVQVRAGDRVERGTELALSGNTGFSSTPHLHFQLMTAGDDGVSARSFPFQLAVGPHRIEEPIQGRSYTAWE